MPPESPVTDPTTESAKSRRGCSLLRGLGRLARHVALLYAWILVAVLALRLAVGEQVPLLATISHLFHLLLIPAPLILLTVWWSHRRRSTIAPAICTVTLLWMCVPWYLPAGNATAEPSGRTLVVLTWNLGFNAPEPADVARQIRDLDPDFVALQEAKRATAEQLFVELADLLPYHSHREAGPFSKAYLSRIRPTRSEMVHLTGTTYYLETTIPFDGQPLTITNIHCSKGLAWKGRSWPGSETVLDHIAAIGARRDQILVGDFNTTERSESYARIVDSGLVDSFRETNTGPGFTFPAFGRYHGLLVPPVLRIDYLWHTSDLTCHRTAVTSNAGSDHHGVVGVFSR